MVRLWESISEFVGNPRSAVNNEFFYLGNVVTYSNDDVVDGQQRMTALTVISCALRDVLIQLKQTDLAEKFHHSMIRDRKTGTFRYELNQKYIESCNALRQIRTPRTKVDFGMTISNEAEIGRTGLMKTVEFEINGKANWSIFDGDRVFSEDGEELVDFKVPTGSLQAGTKGSLMGITAKVPISTPSLIGEKLVIGLKPNDFINHEITKAYRSIGGLFYHNLCTAMEVTSVFKSKNITKLYPKHTTPEQLRFSMPNLEWFMPIQVDNQSKLKLEETRAGGTTYTITNQRKSGGMHHHSKILNLYANFTHKTEITHCKISFPRSSSYTTLDSALLNPVTMMNRYIEVIQNMKFSVINFDKYSDALNFFTIANDGTRMEPLYNYDLLHAFSHSIIDTLGDMVTAPEKKASTDIQALWTNLANKLVPTGMDRRSALQHSNKILGRYCLSRNLREDNGNRYGWQISKGARPDSQIFSRLEKELKANSAWFKSGVPTAGSKDFFQNLTENVMYHDVCSDPVNNIKDSAGSYSFLSPKIGALLTILNRKSGEIFIPLFMMILERHRKSKEVDRSAAMEECLRTIIYFITRYWIYSEHVEKSKPNIMKLSQKDLYHFYTKSGGWCEKLNDKSTPITDIPTQVKDAFTEWEADCKKNGQTAPNWPVPASDRHFDVNDTDAGFLLYCFQFTNTHAKKYEDRFLRKKRSKDSTHPELEHILPKTEKIKEPWWATSWPRFTMASTWRVNKEKLGNRCLLEDYINRAWGKKQDWTKKSDKKPKAKSIPNSDFYNEQFLTPLPKNLTPAYIKKRSGEIWDGVCKEFKP